MTTARDIMHAGATCVREHETLTTAAQHMRDLGVGALPICGDDDRLHGMITDRDIDAPIGVRSQAAVVSQCR
jgi:CBS domain-containing protein